MGQPTPHLPPRTPEAGKYLPSGQQLRGSRRPLCVVAPRWVAVSTVWEESPAPATPLSFVWRGLAGGVPGGARAPHPSCRGLGILWGLLQRRALTGASRAGLRGAGGRGRGRSGVGESGGQREIGGARPCAGVAACVWSAALTVLDLSKALCCPSQSVPEQRAQGDHHHLAATRDAPHPPPDAVQRRPRTSGNAEKWRGRAWLGGRPPTSLEETEFI